METPPALNRQEFSVPPTWLAGKPPTETVVRVDRDGGVAVWFCRLWTNCELKLHFPALFERCLILVWSCIGDGGWAEYPEKTPHALYDVNQANSHAFGKEIGKKRVYNPLG
ncbi:hypothetical protein DPMN_043970 [Dreissena polymorpha]|uniref:Uncharacterized protein n=1 Tax=Dreissena polymorpha TaxID=45954 RepID=A0A9D4HW32_DREPO|nr:hypothetical protein DPMN_043970 [Dreissena polymorpha]